VEQVGCLERHRVADFRGNRDGLLRGSDHAARRHRHAGRGQDRSRTRVPGRGWSYALVLGTLVLLIPFPFASLLELPEPLRALIAATVVGAPMFGAALVFSASLRQETRIESALGSNLLGVVVGGALEPLSNVLGLRALYGLALALYIGSLLLLPRRRV
jgi:hypothetical protein